MIYLNIMIRSFKHKDAEAIFEGRPTRRFKGILAVAERKLQMLDVAKSIEDLKSPPGNHLEVLKGDRRGQYSIRINDKWRICFRYEDGEVLDVEIVDYHH